MRLSIGTVLPCALAVPAAAQLGEGTPTAQGTIYVADRLAAMRRERTHAIYKT